MQNGTAGSPWVNSLVKRVLRAVVVMVLPNGSSDVSRITTNIRVIALNTPNTTSVGTAWSAYRTSADAIEAVAVGFVAE